MASSLLLVLAAASLAGADATSATRSSQAIPHEHLQIARTLPVASSRTSRTANRLVDATNANPSNQGACERDRGSWDTSKSRCRRATSRRWQEEAGFVIAAGTLAGGVDAITSNESSTPNQDPVSN